jgi:Flp pilus assembly pilin Flp
VYLVRSFIQDGLGASAIEYAIIAAGISILVISVASALAGKVA